MERSAPVSRVERARWRRWGDVVGVGRRALRVRSWRFAFVRREAILGAEGGGWDWSWVSVVVRSVVDIVCDDGGGGGRGGCGFGVFLVAELDAGIMA